MSAAPTPSALSREKKKERKKEKQTKRPLTALSRAVLAVVGFTPTLPSCQCSAHSVVIRAGPLCVRCRRGAAATHRVSSGCTNTKKAVVIFIFTLFFFFWGGNRSLVKHLINTVQNRWHFEQAVRLWTIQSSLGRRQFVCVWGEGGRRGDRLKQELEWVS